MMRRRSTIVCLGLTAALATSLTGCGSQDDGDPEYTGICVDKATGVRLEDSVCESDPLPEETDFTAVEAAATPGSGVTTTGSARGSTTTSSGGSAATGTGTSTLPTTGATTGTPTTASTLDCVPATGAATGGSTVTATLPSAASPTGPGDTSTLWQGACPPGQTPSGSPSPATTTVYRNSGSHGWFFIPWGWVAPPIGGYAGRGSYAPPTNTRYSRGGMAPTGGSVGKTTVKGGKVSTSRGGFGGSGGKVGS